MPFASLRRIHDTKINKNRIHDLQLSGVFICKQSWCPRSNKFLCRGQTRLLSEGWATPCKTTDVHLSLLLAARPLNISDDQWTDISTCDRRRSGIWHIDMQLVMAHEWVPTYVTHVDTVWKILRDRVLKFTVVWDMTPDSLVERQQMSWNINIYLQKYNL